VLLYPLVLAYAARSPELPALFGLAFVFNLTTLAPTVFFIVGQQQLGRRWWLLLPAILLISALGAGMMLNTLRAALEIVFQRGAAFERTPKFGLSRRGQHWEGRRYQLRLDLIIFAELALALLNLGTVAAALASGSWAIVVHAALFSAGLFFTSLTTLAQALAVRRSRGPIIAAAPAVIPAE